MKHIKKILAAGICLAASLYLTPAMAAYEIDPDYTMKYNDPGKIEQRYRWHGPYEVKSVVLSDGEAKYGNYKYKVWYPVQQAGRERPRPLVITLNGTGGSCDKDEPIFRHLASWGFVVAGNTDAQTATGFSAEWTLDQALAANQDSKSPLYHQIDEKEIDPDYTMKYNDPGKIEQRYRWHGPYEVKSVVLSDGEAKYGNYKYKVWYPVQQAGRERPRPLVITLNGTGGSCDKDEPIFRHLASWGFVVAGNTDAQTATGFSAEWTLDQALAANQDSKSPLYHQIDEKEIGIVGYSQGGAGAYNTLEGKDGDKFKTMVTVSGVTESIGEKLHLPVWIYDPSKVTIPVFMAAGTGILDRKLITPLDEMKENYSKIQSKTAAMGRRKDADHLDIQTAADAYITAWLRWQLDDDIYAKRVFTGKAPEILRNPAWDNAEVRNPETTQPKQTEK